MQNMFNAHQYFLMPYVLPCYQSHLMVFGFIIIAELVILSGAKEGLFSEKIKLFIFAVKERFKKLEICHDFCH